MKFLHTSDTHSCFISLPEEGEFIVHSGDLLPNLTRGNREIERKFQTQWVKDNIEKFKKWLDGREFLFCEGNHDFIDPCETLNQSGIKATNITNKFIEYKGINFYGFPFIPFIAGEWNHERTSSDMFKEWVLMERKHKDQFKKNSINILVSHSPPFGVLDGATNRNPASHFGNSIMANILLYNDNDLNLSWILSGHIHESPGFDKIAGIKVSQAATTAHLIEV